MTQLDKVAFLLADGFTKKEIAEKLQRSYHTINQETRILYQRTGSRNLADITRKTISRLLNIDIETELSSIVGKIIAVSVIIAILLTCLLFPEAMNSMKEYLSQSFASFEQLLNR